MFDPSAPDDPVVGQFRSSEPFWRRKRLEEMSGPEWESLCDGCGRCCLVKLEDEETGRVHYTDVACRLLDHGTCRCRSYETRQQQVPDCLRLTPEAVRAVTWLPPTCGYRVVAEGRDLYWWHPLVSGDPATPTQAGITVRGRVAGSEEDFAVEDLMDQVTEWPERVPRGARERKPGRAAIPGRVGTRGREGNPGPEDVIKGTAPEEAR